VSMSRHPELEKRSLSIYSNPKVFVDFFLDL
jgi:hypothetical protein